MSEQPDGTRQIRAVLDRSAIQSYGRGHVHVGEVITEIVADNVVFGVPAIALLEAHSGFLDDSLARARLDVLIQLPGAETLDLTAEIAKEVAEMTPFTEGDLSISHAIWAALAHSALYLTSEPKKSARAVGDDQIIVIPAEDA